MSQDNFCAKVNGVDVSCNEQVDLIDLEGVDGINLEFMCRAGACGVCTVLVSSGEDHVSPLTENEKVLLPILTEDKRVRLGCQVQLNGDVELESLEFI